MITVLLLGAALCSPTTAVRSIGDIVASLGRGYRVENALAGELVLVSGDVSKEKLENALAQVANAEWVIQDETVTLRRNPAKWRVESQKARFSAISVGLNALPRFQGNSDQRVREVISRLQDFVSAYQTSRPISFIPDLTLPVDRLLSEAVVGIGASQLARLPDRKPVVYALEPNSNQRRLPGNIHGLLATVGEERRDIAAMASHIESITSESVVSDWIAWRLKGYNNTAKFSKVLLLLVRTDQAINCSLGLYDANEQLVESAHRSIPLEYETELPFLDQLKPFSIAPWQNEFLTKKKVDDFRQRIASVEPLSIVVSDAIAAYGRVAQLNVVALLDDRLLPAAPSFVHGGEFDTKAWLKHCARQGLITFHVEDDCLIGKPNLAIQADEHRLNRPELRKLLLLPELGYKAIAAFSRQSKATTQSNPLLAMLLLTGENSGLAVARVDRQPEQATLLYSVVAEQCRPETKRSWRLPAVTLPHLAKELICDWAASGLTTLEGEKPQWQLHGTNAMPNGLPDTAIIEINESEEDVLSKPDSPFVFLRYPRTANSIRQYIYDIRAGDARALLEGTVMFGKSMEWQISVIFANGVRLKSSALDVPVMERMSFADVPILFRRRLSDVE